MNLTEVTKGKIYSYKAGDRTVTILIPTLGNSCHCLDVAGNYARAELRHLPKDADYFLSDEVDRQWLLNSIREMKTTPRPVLDRIVNNYPIY